MSQEQFKPSIEGPCVIWPGTKNPGGYGQFSSKSGGKWRTVLAHRYFYELVFGPIPVGLQIDHLCRNRACVSPAHLEVVTSKVNSLRGMGTSAINARRTHCVNGHALTDDNVLRYGKKKDHRQCRTCNRLHQRAMGRAKCSECGASVPVRVNGRLSRHSTGFGWRKTEEKCTGSWIMIPRDRIELYGAA